MRIPVIFSVTFHILVLGSMWVTLPDLLNNKPKNEEPIIVELVALEEDLTSLKEVKNKRKTINKEKQSIKSKPIVKPVSQVQEAQNKEVVEIFEPKQKPKVKKNIIKDNYIDQTKLRPRLKPKPPKKVKDFDTNRISLLIDKSRKKIDEDKNIEKKKENNFLNKPKLTDGVLNEIDKKIYLINDNYFWTPLEKLFESLSEKQLVDQRKLKKNFRVCKLKELKSEFKNRYAKNRS